MKTKHKIQIPASANLISDAEELTALLHEDYLNARENPNVKFHVLQGKKDMYFLARSIALKLHDLQFYRNENFEIFDVIADAVKRCENAPEISKLKFVIKLDPSRKSVALRLLENLVNMERNDL
jgi:hypothetical protein